MSTNQLINSSDYQIVKRKVHGMAETEPKKAKLDICQTIDSTPSSLNYQQVIKSDSVDKDNSDSTKSDNILIVKEDLDIDLKNGQIKSLTTHGKSLNNNNLNAINLNNIKTDLNKEGETLNKTDTNVTPSHVVHLRNIPNDATEAEILNFGSNFGNTVNCLLLKGKNQAFLEFADLDSAKSMVNCWNLNYQQQQNNFNGKTNFAQLPTIRGRQIFVQYSNYKKLSKTNDAKVDSINNLNKNYNYNQINNSKIILLNEDILFNKSNNLINQQSNSEQSVQSYLSSSINPLNKNLNNNSLMVSKNMGGTNLQTNSRINNGNSSSHIQPSSVLRVIVDNMMYLVPLETFHELFSRFGKVTKIVTFNKNGAFQALIQFDSNSAAASAKSAYDGQQMFTSGNLLRIEYSKLSNLSVKYNNEKSRDFTNSNLPAGPTLTANSVLSSVRNGAAAAAAAAAASNSLVGSNSLAGLNTHLNPQQLALAAAASAAQQQQHYQHLEHVFSDPLTLAGISSFPGLTNSLPYASLRSTLNTQGNGAVANSLGNVLSRNDLSTVLLVSNLSEQMATPDALFTLFGVYGDVIRVKILFNKKDNALVQMSCITQAQLVITFLDKINLFGNVLKISISKYSNVQMPKEGQPDSGLTKDYTSSPLHRFKKPGSKNYQNIFPPSSTLHLSNIPSSCTEQQLREAFESIANVKVVNFKFFPNDQKMALIQLNSIEDAVSALIKMHNYQLSESNHLRVSFSKSSI